MWWLLLVPIVAALVYIFPLARVYGDSMEPTMYDGEIYLCRRILFPLKAFSKRGSKYIQRVLVVKSSSGNDPARLCVKRLIRITRRNKLWIEGDNKEVSFDSRMHGAISPQMVIAIVLRRLQNGRQDKP